MKKQAITLSLLTLTALPASAAIDCAVIPTCAELGYNDTVASCMDPDNVLKCPFDKTLGKCLGNGAVVGQIGYFSHRSPGDGWLPCDGYYYSKDEYPDLYAKITTSFGGTGNIFRVPDYAGDFVRVYGGNSGSLTQRQKQGLPNIYGTLKFLDDQAGNAVTGAFSVSNASGYDAKSEQSGTARMLTFNASLYNSIYGASSHVTPVNTAVAAYIYAGKKVASATSAHTTAAKCAVGNYLYTDGTCSSSYTSGKTVKGIVRTVSTYAGSATTPAYAYVSYIRGGTSGASNCSYANTMCTNNGEWLQSHYDALEMPTVSTSQYVVANIKSGSHYCSYSTDRPYLCNASSCSQIAASAVATSGSTGTSAYPYYYCYGYMYFR